MGGKNNLLRKRNVMLLIRGWSHNDAYKCTHPPRRQRFAIKRLSLLKIRIIRGFYRRTAMNMIINMIVNAVRSGILDSMEWRSMNRRKAVYTLKTLHTYMGA